MFNLSVFIFVLAITQISFGAGSSVDLNLVEKDIQSLFKKAQSQSGLTPTDKKIKISWSEQNQTNTIQNTVQLLCANNTFEFKVQSSKQEILGTTYYAIRRLGFLFPHPRITITPEFNDITKNCNNTWAWKPILNERGFHLHTQHASEWVDGFFMQNHKIAEDTIWWLARNQQNLLQLQTLRMDDDFLSKKLNPLAELSNKLGIQFGLSFSFAMFQQKNYYLIPIWRAFFGIDDEKFLREKLQQIIQTYKFDYITSELGTTEFTPISEERTINWMNIVQDELTKHGKRYFIKAHVSSNQVTKKYGNFNFLPQYAHKNVGVQAHTVFFYGLTDDNTPMYGRKNFADMTQFMKDQQNKREVWYFPETSYYIAMDIDVPLLLTDYLVARANDMKFLKENNFTGQVNFSTGQELGYWIFDWTLALLNDTNFNQDPLAGLKLLGENTKQWKAILDWQTEFIKNKQMIQPISASNLMDELYPLIHKVHERNLFRELLKRPDLLAAELKLLEEALPKRPSLNEIKIEELKILLEVTYMRVEHAYQLRKALQAKLSNQDMNEHLSKAAQLTERARELMEEVERNHNRYPESFVFRQAKNPSSYQYGYGWPAKTLHFWQREELQIKNNSFWNPLLLNIYNPLSILL
jgi:hypothetical protein